MPFPRFLPLLDRHIFRTVTASTTLALVALLLLESFLRLLVELEDVGKGAYSFRVAATVLLLRQPQFLSELFPMALLLGGLMGMGGLARDAELIVMRTAGRSLLRLSSAALLAGLVLSMGVLAISEWVAPPLAARAQEKESAARDNLRAIGQGKGFWMRDGQTVVYVQTAFRGTHLSDIQLFSLAPEDGRLVSLTTAQRARYTEGQWHLEGVQRRTWGAQRVATEKLPHLTLPSAISPRILDVLATDPDALSMQKLWIYIDYLTHNGLETQPYWLALWRKLLAPLSHIAMLVVGLPFVFGPARTGGAGQRMLMGILLGLLFFLSNYLLGNVVLLYDVPAILGAGLPTLLFMSAGLWALYRLR